MIKSIIFLSFMLFSIGLILESHETHISKPVLIVEKMQYSSGDIVTLSGWVDYDNNPTSDVLLRILVTDPKETVIFDSFDTSKADGTFFTEISIPENSITGEYRIDVTSHCREVHREICTHQHESLKIIIDGTITDNIESKQSQMQKMLTPLQQINDGVKPTDVTCTEGLSLVLKLSTGNPACVKSSSVERLIERGWAEHVLPDVNSDVIQNSELMMEGNYQVETSNVSYDSFTGFLASPISDESHPGVILIHEWWGLNDYIKQTAEKLASQGYVVLAVDLFNGKVATDAQTAMKLTGAFVQDDAIVNMNSAVDYLQTTHNVDSVGSIGWCFGGKQSLTLALNNDEMDATVIYYGRLVTEPEALSAINWPVLGIFAELDQGITPETVNEFEDALNQAGVTNDIHIYEGVDHAFSNPTGERYAPQEADDAWKKTLEFLETNLK